MSDVEQAIPVFLEEGLDFLIWAEWNAMLKDERVVGVEDWDAFISSRVTCLE